ncbi:MAG: hypothetical protein M1821_003692 [Bathelium mastoideum]|nr:MAG: hypothetical protein M1821_003692 [Bathelium mastoideum]KAI9690774.1 MAG: hypothetical protein M1822_008393 [Bathelium mastoideum]
MSHTYTKKWHSEEFTANRQWANEMKSFNNKFPDYPFKPLNRPVFFDDCRKFALARADIATRKVASTEEWNRVSYPDEKKKKPFWGKVFAPDAPYPRTTVLSQQSNWINMDWYPDFEVLAPWPSPEERKYEGDDRVNSRSGRNFGRFPALPRWPNPNTNVSWTMWDVVPFHPFDEVRQIPTAYDIYMPEENDMRETEIPHYLNDSLMEAIEDAGKINC